MKLITRNTDYAVRAVALLAGRKDRTVSVSEMVRSLKIPRPFLRKILQALGKAGIVASRKGIGGGFTLTRPAEKIFLIDLIRVFQGLFRLNECLLGDRLCPNRSACPLKNKIDGIERRVASELGTITIKSLL